MKFFYYLIIIIFTFSLSFSTGCYKEKFYEGNDVTLRFSVDTLTFDTVFTSVGSATKSLKVYNDQDLPINIKEIKIENNTHNQFRLNIDGIAAQKAQDIEIGAHDSIYIFAETKINPDDPISISPFIIEDHLVFNTNGNTQKVLLEAWGQNANYITGKGKGKHFLTTCEMGELVWDDPKPYVIYGSLHIDSCSLVLPENTKIYVHGGIAKNIDGQYYYDGNMFFHKNSKLISQGTAKNPVIIQTDRLEQKYQDINALWSGIYFLPECTGSVLNYTTIQNATVGIYMDSMSSATLNECKIYHIGAIGIYSRHADLKANNCLIADIGGYNVVVDYGGNIDLKYCTIYNNNKDDALVLKNYKCLDPDCNDVEPYALNANFTNCIIYGTNNDELLLSNATKNDESKFNYYFQNCLLKIKDLTQENQYPHFFDNTVECINGAGDNNLFLDISKYNYRPDTMAIVIDKGININEITNDIEGLPRDSAPDIGCYEFQK